MENINQTLSNLETVELQILGSLFKIKNNNNISEAVGDLQRTSRRLKAMVKSIQCKVHASQKEIEGLRKENEQLQKLKEENAALKKKLCESEGRNQNQKKRINELQESLGDAECLMASFGSAHNEEMEEPCEDNDSQDMFLASAAKKPKP